MKALLYTLILSAILVVSVIYLRSIQPELDAGGEFEESEVQQPMAVRSDPAVRPRIGAKELEQANEEALYETGIELLDLWHLSEAIDVFETLAGRNPHHLETYLRLVECYSHPIIGAEKRVRECWQRAWDKALRGERDTLWVSAVGNLFIDRVPSSAADKLAKVLQRDGQDLEARLLIAKALLMDRRPGEAERYLEDLLEGDESLGRARELLVHCKVITRHYESAESLATELVAVYPEEPYPHVLLSRVQLIRERSKRRSSPVTTLCCSMRGTSRPSSPGPTSTSPRAREKRRGSVSKSSSSMTIPFSPASGSRASPTSISCPGGSMGLRSRWTRRFDGR